MKSVIKNFLKRIPSSIKSSAVIFLSTFITSALSLIVTPVFTRLMSVEEYGLIAQYNSWTNIITVFATLSLEAGVYQVAMNEFPKDRDRFTFSSMLLSNACTFITFIIIFIINATNIELFDLPQHLLWLMFIYLLFNPAMTMWLARQRYEYNYIKVAILSISTSFLSQIISLIAILILHNCNLGSVRLWAMQLPMIIVSIVIYYEIAKKSSFKPSFKYIKYALTFNLPLLGHYLAQYALRSTDKIMITHYVGKGATGVYSLSATVANIAMLAWAAMSASLTPYLYSKLNTKQYKKINQAIVMVEGIFAVCCCLVSLIGPEVILVLGSKKYIAGIQLIPPIAASCILSAVYSFYSSIAFYYHKTSSTAVMTIIAAIINFVLNLFWIPRYGFIAAAYTTEFAYLVYTLLHFFNYKHIVKKEKIYNNYVIWIIVVITTIICLLSGFLYNHIIVRYSLVIFIIIGGSVTGWKILKKFQNVNK